MKKFFIKSLNGMAFGLFSSLIVGLILKQIGTLFNIEFLIYLGGFSQLLMGAGIGVGVAYALESPVLILISSAITGMYGAGSINFVDGQAILKVGEPMGAYFSVIFGLLISKQIAGKTKFDIILLPMTTIIFGCLLGKFFAPYISAVISEIGIIVNKTTELRPILMGLTMSVIMGIILTLPISSAAIGISLGLSGLAAGASLTGCCCQMIGFAVMSYDDNDLGTVFSIGFGTSMIQIPNIIKNPIIWIPPIVSSAILGVLSTTVFKLSSNSIASGMGTSGLVGQIASFSVNGMSYLPTMIILHFILPAILTFIIYKILKKKGYIKVGDLKI
ncbi:PTS transporter subunit IIC [Fusobacterium polymorphum]|uniref:PTS transporter subunit IIC n=1 Tax=Fusobacterium nucleatum subsp. polymorphum TaxID=76857 RepID=UPI00300B003B